MKVALSCLGSQGYYWIYFLKENDELLVCVTGIYIYTLSVIFNYLTRFNVDGPIASLCNGALPVSQVDRSILGSLDCGPSCVCYCCF